MISIAIDGPAGAGKSTLSRKAAEELGFIYVDTGALYRAIALKFIRTGLKNAEGELEGLLEATKVDIRFSQGEQRVFLDGEDVSELIRTPEVSMMASAASARPEVRSYLLEMQRRLARENNVLMDGRDIGTVVLPDATVKIFLTASPEVRAARRYRELCEKGQEVSYDEVYKDMVQRDYNDSHREIAPLKAAHDAVVADTSECEFDQSLALIMKIIRERIEKS